MRRSAVDRGWRVALVAIAASAVAGCVGEVKPKIVAGVDACDHCGMVIDQPLQACGYVADGEFVTFDSPLCLLQGFDERRTRGQTAPTEMYFADYLDAGLHSVDQVYFLLTVHLPTVMNSGVVCFASLDAATDHREHPDDVLTDWAGFRTARGTPDVVFDLSFGAAGMVPDVVDAAKGDLVLLRVSGSGLGRDLAISIDGYPEVEAVTLPESGERVELRVLASRPGGGFPIKDASSGVALGRLRVSGAHTEDEEAM